MDASVGPLASSHNTPHPQPEATPTSSSTEKIICNGCKLTLEENGTASDGVVVSFGNSLWHVDCFRCAKCRNLVEHDTNLLLLSDGSPVCENCSYICSVCKEPISNEAIVTGEESYHADCFRCRSCSNRIEELIFAKTSQGIYCMTCHNERVTRSRRHAEAKRNKAGGHSHNSRKDKERDKDRAGNSSTHRSKSKPSHSQKSPQTANSTSNSFNLPGSSIDHSQSLANLNHSHVPLSPHTPQLPLKSRTSWNSLLKPRSPAPTSLGFLPGESTSSDHAHPKLQTSKSTSNMFGHHRRGDSASSIQNRSTTVHSPANQRTIHHSTDLPSLNLSRPSIPRSSSADNQGSLISPILSSFPNSALKRSNGSSSQLNASTHSSNKPVGISPSESVRFSQSDKTELLNSSFESTEVQNRTKHRSASLGSSAVNPQPEVDLNSDQHQAIATMHHPTFSYGDIFSSLDHDHLSTPLMSSSFLSDPHRLMTACDLSVTDSDNNATADMDSQVNSRPSDIEQLRKSIHLSRGGLKDSDLGLDVGLVEQLLWELDDTKERMKTLQEEYLKMSKAGASPSSYDNQIVEREDAELKMRELKAKMVEQASRLKELDSMKTLEKKSEELRHSVSGLQKHLSELVAERDFRVAEVEALTDIGEAVKKGDQISETAQGLSGRFDQIRDRYLREIQELAAERDKLKEEITHLAKVQESQAKELDSLNSRADALTEMNAQAVKQLEKSRDTAARLHGRPLPSASKLSSQSPTAPCANQEAEFHIQMSPEVNIATTRKFKWGKSHAHKASATRHHGAHHAKNPSSISGSEVIGNHLNNNLSNVTGINDANGTHNMISNSSSTVSHHPGGSIGSHLPAINNSSSNPIPGSIVGLRPHNFQPVSALRPVRCDYCGEKLWGLAEVRCSACGSYCHTKCAANFFGCQAQLANAAPGSNEEEVESVIFGNDLIAQAKSENKLIPSVVTKCIDAIDQNALKFEGIYRKTGGMSSVKMIQTCFESGTNMNLSDLNKFNDISAITSVLKNYFRQLPNPLFTFELHEAFVAVATMQPESIRLEALERVLYQLPQVHFETLKVLMTHLSKIEKLSEFNKMTPSNLGVIFGPTLMRSSNQNRQFSDMPFTTKIVELTVLNKGQLFRKPYPNSILTSSSTSSHAPTPNVPTTASITTQGGSSVGSLSASITSSSLVSNVGINNHSNLINSSTSNPSLSSSVNNHQLPSHLNNNPTILNPTLGPSSTVPSNNLSSSFSHPHLTTT